MVNTDVIKSLIETLDNYELSLLNTLLIGECENKDELIETDNVSHTFQAIFHLTWDLSPGTTRSLVVFITDLLHKKLLPHSSHKKHHDTHKVDHSFMGYT